MRILFAGIIARYPFGGVTWCSLMYLLGLRALGHEVFYIEDTGECVYDPVQNTRATDPRYGTSYIHRALEPFANAAKLQIDTRFGSNQSADLAAEVRATQQGKRILICWRHGNIPDLLRALGAIPETLLPRGKWPDAVYDWVILLSYDQDGRLIPASTRRINEHLMPGDSQ